MLVEVRDLDDPETGGHYTVKLYESDKRVDEGRWAHEEIRLHPDTEAPGFEPIVLRPASDNDVRVVAELVAVLGVA